MSVNPQPDGIQGANTNNVSNDFRPAFVGHPNDYTTAMNQQMALPVPLGSQLNLLTMQNMGNPYIDPNRLSDQKLSSLQNVLTGYNTLTFNSSGNAYGTFSSSYGGN